MIASVIHLVVDGKTACGITASPTVATVPPQRAKFVTCRRCLASLRRITQ